MAKPQKAAELPQASSGRTALEVAAALAREAGAVLLSHFHEKRQVRHKGRSDLVSDADLLVDKLLKEKLRGEYPDFALLTEESGGALEASGYRWIVDPLDGTRNYILGIPFFAVNLALTLGDEVLLAVTYSPCHNELFRAQRGAGAFLNDVPFSVSQREALEDAVLGFEAGYDDEKARQGLRLASQIWPGVQALRMMGSAALGLAYTACGRIDLYFHHYVFPWDVAPGILLVQEAGGVITDRVGKPIDLKERELGLIASNQALHAQFLRRVRRHPWQRA